MLQPTLLVHHLEQSFSLLRSQRGPTPTDDMADSSDFWRAIRERHPCALTFARGPRPSLEIDLPEQINGSKMTPRNGFPSSKLAPILPSKFRLSFLRRQPSTSVSPKPPLDNAPHQRQTSLQLPEFTFRRNHLHHYHTYPRSHHHSLTYIPRVYFHTSQLEFNGDTSPPPSRGLNYHRRMSLPTIFNPLTVNSAMHMCVSVESSAVTSTRASLMSIVTDSLALGSRLESVLDVERGSDCI
jgi:hypothetical protein